MTAKEYIQRLRKFESELLETQPFFEAAANVVREQSIRVFENGGVGNNGSKVEYKGGPIYVNPKISPRSFPLKGKNGGGAKFKNGNPRKTSFFDSYSDFKKKIGQTSNVNLVLFGNLQRAYGTGLKIQKTSQGATVIHSIQVSSSNPEGKINALIDKYPYAFKPTAKERAQYFQDLQNYISDARKRVGL